MKVEVKLDQKVQSKTQSELSEIEKSIPKEALDKLINAEIEKRQEEARVNAEAKAKTAKEALEKIATQIKDAIKDEKGNYSKAHAVYRFKYEEVLKNYKTLISKESIEKFVVSLNNGEYKTLSTIDTDSSYIMKLFAALFKDIEPELKVKGIDLQALLAKRSIIKM